MAKDNFKVMGVIDESLGKTSDQSQYVYDHEQRWYGRATLPPADAWAGNNFT